MNRSLPRPLALLRRWAPVVAWMAVIFTFSSQPRPLGPVSDAPYAELIGRLSHVAEYAVLALLWYRALGAGSWRGAGIAFAASVAYAATDELHHHFVPGREGSLVDVGYDALGAAAALLVARAWARTHAESRRAARNGGEG